MTTKQVKYVRGLLLRAGMHDQKEDVVMQYTNNRTSHLTDMTHTETQALIAALNGESSRDKMIRKMLSMSHEMGWEYSNGKVNMGKLNEWCKKYTKLHQPLYEISTEELPQVVTTFTKVYHSFLKGI